MYIHMHMGRWLGWQPGLNSPGDALPSLPSNGLQIPKMIKIRKPCTEHARTCSDMIGTSIETLGGDL